MNNRNRQSSLQLSQIVSLAGTLLMASPVLAHPGDHHGPNMMREMRALNPGMNGRELRQLMRNEVSAPQASNTAVQIQNFTNHRLERFNSQSHFMNDAGRMRAIRSGFELDLTSAQRSIVLGDRLFANSSSYAIKTGGQERILTSGNTVSAAEYVALQQVISGGEQKLVVDGSGRGISGEFSLNSISDGGTAIRASALVIPEQVVASGDFARNADGLRVTNDLTNFGSINAYSSNERRNTARISARDINNEVGGSISSNADLSLHADRDINNSGSISSSGNLTLTASNINNKGLIASSNGNINLAGNGDADLFVNNSFGVIDASNGAINVRSADYTGAGNSTISGGDLISQELNLFTGQGSADVFVNELTGVVSSSGSAAHVSSNTETLTIGTQCLLGDPTYFNLGDIILGGNIIVGEKLAIIAGGSITSTAANLVISTQDGTNQGHDIVIIAGANITTPSAGQITPAGGPATLPAQGAVPSENSTGDVTVDPNSPQGGNIDLLGVTGSLTINAGSTGTNLSGGNVTLAAFENSGAGQIRLPSFSQINTAGDGIGNNGNVKVYAGALIGNAISLGDIVARGGVGTVNSGKVEILNFQPAISNGNPITFDVSGAITTGNTIVAPLIANASTAIITVGDISSSGDVVINGGGAVGVGNILASGIIGADPGKVVMITSTSSNVQTGTINADGGGNSNGGSINVFSNGSSGAASVTAASAGGGVFGTAGGTIVISNTGTGGILLGNGVFYAGSSFDDGGSVSINAGPGVLTADAGIIIDVGSGLGGTNGQVTISAASITCNTGGLQILSDNGSGGIINITTTVGGINTNGNDFGARVSEGTLSLNITSNAISVGGTGDSGNLELDAASIIFPSTFQAPLALFANGSGTGDGGSIEYTNRSPVPTFIGTPVKVPKPPANFLTVSAHAGATDGDGGTLLLIVGGSLTAAQDSLDVSVAPGGLLHNGGTIFISSGLTNPAGGPIVITGDIFAAGNNGGIGGSIVLSSVSKKNFVAGATKTQKNGIFGNIVANGAAGSGNVSIVSSSGIQLATSAGIQAGNVSLTANGKGKISSKGQTLFGTSVSANSQSGDITLLLSSSTMSLASISGDVTVSNSNVGATVLNNSNAGGNFTLNTLGPLAINGASADDGDLTIVTGPNNGGTLQVLGNVRAINGTLTLENDDVVAGDISVADGTIIETLGEKGGEVAIVIGPVPKKPVNPIFGGTEPPNFSVFNNGGQVFIGQNPNDVVANFFTTLIAENADVILNNGSTDPSNNKIEFFGNNLIKADPPSRSHINAIPVPAVFAAATTGSIIETARAQNMQIVRFPSEFAATLPTDLMKKTIAPVAIESIHDSFGYSFIWIK